MRPVLELELQPRRRELALEILAALPDLVVYGLAALLVHIALTFSRNFAAETAPIVPWLTALVIPLAAFELAYVWPRRRGLRLRLDARGLVAEVGGRTLTAGWRQLVARETSSATVLFFAAWTPGVVLPHRLLGAAERARLAQLLDDAGVVVSRRPLAAVRQVLAAALLATLVLAALSWLTMP
jgi:hypothetical protein